MWDWVKPLHRLEVTLAKVSDRNSIRTNQSYSKPFRNLFSNQYTKSFASRLMKIGQKSFRLNPIHSTSIRDINTNQYELRLISTEFSIFNLNQSGSFPPRIHSDSNSSRINQIKSDWFLTDFYETRYNKVFWLEIFFYYFQFFVLEIFQGSDYSQTTFHVLYANSKYLRRYKTERSGRSGKCAR